MPPILNEPDRTVEDFALGAYRRPRGVPDDDIDVVVEDLFNADGQNQLFANVTPVDMVDDLHELYVPNVPVDMVDAGMPLILNEQGAVPVDDIDDVPVEDIVDADGPFHLFLNEQGAVPVDDIDDVQVEDIFAADGPFHLFTNVSLAMQNLEQVELREEIERYSRSESVLTQFQRVIIF
ncbi:hypothetical protein GOP47_0017804 [Adiantum capillus-veneris]|uniref:Uncharacterized protein n=1 Tax=Adiantum capillus-veneris TaxID=13818 RepID=A0A9D4UH87_ADICA|nr:hypothetical protein GOP47_0017804 [Adiantum capillus-veneris]